VVSKIKQWRDFWTLSSSYSDLMQALGATIIGLLSAAGVLFFKQTIRWIHTLLWEDGAGLLVPHTGRWVLLLVPAVGGLVVGLIRTWWLSEERHHGVASVMEAVALAGGRLRYKETPLKVLVSAISLGSGASVGPEDPSVQIGASIGSFFGQKFHMSDQRTRVFVGAGVAAGIATAFNAPIAGVFFAVEIISGDFFISSFGMIVLSAVMAAVLTRALVGPQPAFPIPLYTYHGPMDLPFYLGLGLLAAPVALLYIQAIYWAHDFFHHLKLPKWLSPVLIGLLIGAVGLYYPQILGDSYEAVGDILNGREMVLGALVILVFLKIIFTALSLGAGFIGGVFAPSLFLGAALGGAYGLAMQHLFPTLHLVPSAFALVGMAAVLAGTVHAPVTAIMLLFEMTDDYRIVLPLMFAVTVSILVSQYFQPESVYSLGLVRDGLRLRRGRDIDVLESIKVKEVMEPRPVTIRADMPLLTVSAMFDQFHTHGLPVVDKEGRLIGIITLQDLQRALAEDPENPHRTAGDVCRKRLVVAYPEESIKEALHRMSVHEIGRLPVVDPSHPDHLLGWINRASIIRAYELALARRASLEHRGEQMRLEAITEAPVLEMTVVEDAPVAGKTVAEVPWPEGAVLVRVQRGHQLLIPHGDTLLLPNDRLTFVAEPGAVAPLRSLVENKA
jgi:CIC family chloride channel protein